MEKYFNNKNTLVLMLFALIGLSILDLVVRSALLKEKAVLMPDYGAPLVTIILSALLFYFAYKGDDRLFYLVCGGWLIYFFISQIFGLPSAIVSTLSVIQFGDVTGSIALFLRLVGMFCLIIMGCLLVAFMKGGNSHNDVFNLSCFVTILVFSLCVIMSIYDMVSKGAIGYVFAAFSSLTDIVMVFMFTYFVYDCAKAQLSKFQF